MSLVYTKFELLEFFDDERIIDAEAGLIEYTLHVDNDFIFKVYFAIYDEFTSLTLEYNKWANALFNIGLNRITRVELDQKKQGVALLKFYREDQEDPVLCVTLKPTISLQYSIEK